MSPNNPVRSLALAVMVAATLIGAASLVGLLPIVDPAKARLLHFPVLVISLFLGGAALALFKLGSRG